jgi:hypothetical protein
MEDRWVGGVLSGIAAYFGMDPLILRCLHRLHHPLLRRGAPDLRALVDRGARGFHRGGEA